MKFNQYYNFKTSTESFTHFMNTQIEAELKNHFASMNLDSKLLDTYFDMRRGNRKTTDSVSQIYSIMVYTNSEEIAKLLYESVKKVWTKVNHYFVEVLVESGIDEGIAEDILASWKFVEGCEVEIDVKKAEKVWKMFIERLSS